MVMDSQIALNVNKNKVWIKIMCTFPSQFSIHDLVERLCKVNSKEILVDL